MMQGQKWLQHADDFNPHVTPQMHQFIIKISNLQSINKLELVTLLKKNLEKKPKANNKKTTKSL
jgi:hypothetical protein